MLVKCTCVNSPLFSAHDYFLVKSCGLVESPLVNGKGGFATVQSCCCANTFPLDCKMKRKTKSQEEQKPNLNMLSAIRKPGKGRKLSALQNVMRKKLDGSNFRMLNESMYKTTGASSKQLIQENPELFNIYHAGYSEQVRRWPCNPLDDIIKYLSSQKPSLRVADLGCGEARLAKEAPQKNINSFDLAAANSSVTVCDIANLPLGESSVDVAVFCLSLMGTNYGDFLKEARRVLLPHGYVLIVEVASRFTNHDPRDFVTGVEALGFKMDRNHAFLKDAASAKAIPRRKGKKHRNKKAKRQVLNDTTSSVFFHKFAFKSTKKTTVGTEPIANSKSLPSLGACVYKKR